MTIARIVRRLKSVIGWRELTPALAVPCASLGAPTVTDRGPRHDPIFPMAALPPRPQDQYDVPRPPRHTVRPLRRAGWARGLALVTLTFVLAQLATASPEAGPAVGAVKPGDGAGGWFPVVLVSVNDEPLHEIRSGYLPDVFYADGASCMKGTRAGVAEMARAGIRGRFLCMYPRMPDAALARAVQEDF